MLPFNATSPGFARQERFGLAIAFRRRTVGPWPFRSPLRYVQGNSGNPVGGRQGRGLQSGMAQRRGRPMIGIQRFRAVWILFWKHKRILRSVRGRLSRSPEEAGCLLHLCLTRCEEVRSLGCGEVLLESIGRGCTAPLARKFAPRGRLVDRQRSPQAIPPVVSEARMGLRRRNEG